MAEKKNGENKSVIERAAEFIVDKRKAFYLIYIALAVFSLFSSGWVRVNNDITDYLSEETETRQGLAVMEDNFTTYATAEVMVDNISYQQAEALCEELRETEGVKEIAFDDTDKHYVGASALFSVTFSGDADDIVSQTALEEIEGRLSDYDTYVSAELGNTKAKTIEKEMTVVMAIAVVIILAVLFLTSGAYMEIPVMVLTFGMAAIINKGTNYIFGTISFISDSIAIVLQLALAIDYAIILCHRYTEEREHSEIREAVITALKKAIPEISGSCLTTLSGLAAMSFMDFKIGLDMGLVLIKAIIISILTVFTLMPGLLMSFGKYIDKTHHKNFIPDISAWGRLVLKLRYITPGIFAVLLFAAFIFSNKCPYAYSYTNLSTFTKNESQIASEMIQDTFRASNTLAVIVPTGDYASEKKLLADYEAMEEIDTALGIANVDAIDGYALADYLTPRQFSELSDIDIELARIAYSAYAAKDDDYGKIVGGIDDYGIPLIEMFEFLYEQVDDGYINLDEETSDKLEELNEQLDDAKLQLKSDKYSRLVLDLNLPEESEETFAFLDTVRETAQKYYSDRVYLVGNSTSDLDLSSTFGRDNILISILSIVFVMIILLFTFQSAGIPIILILVIQGSIWMNFAFPALRNTPLFFMSYLVVSSIQMGANIDYAIVITNRYVQLRNEMPLKKAVVMSLTQAFPTVFTSGSILAAAGIAIGLLSSDPAISSIGNCLGRGTIISIFLVMGILPQLLLLGDTIIEKTSFKLKAAPKKLINSGNIKVDGYIRGYINGMVDGSFSGTVDGQLDACVKSVSKQEREASENEE